MEKIIKRLKEFRQELNLTQEELGKKLNINKQIYNTIENNKRKLHLNELIILKNKYNLNPNWLLTGEGQHVYSTEQEFKLIQLILDYQEYGGEVDYVLERILFQILDKLYKKEYIIKIIPKLRYGNRLHYVLMHILKHSNFDSDITEAKNYFRDEIEKFHWKNYAFLHEIKKELYVMLENVTNKDCYYLLKYKEIAMRLILQKIPLLDQKINGLLVPEEHSSNFI